MLRGERATKPRSTCLAEIGDRAGVFTELPVDVADDLIIRPMTSGATSQGERSSVEG